MPARPTIRWLPKNAASETSPTAPAIPNDGVLISIRMPSVPMDRRSGATKGLDRNRTSCSAQLMPTLTTSAPPIPCRSSSASRFSTSAVASPSSTASLAVSVRSFPSAMTPSISISSSTIDSAIRGSSPRRSASARISLRMALTIFSGAFWPPPVTGVAAPMEEAGTMKIESVARAMIAPALHA